MHINNINVPENILKLEKELDTIKTQKGNFMVIEEEVKHLEQDQWYLTKTGYNNHTAFNGSSESRTHLVANLLGEK